MPDPLKLPISSVPPETVVAIAWMVVASFVAVTTHGMIRHVGTTGMHPFQITFFYNLFTIAIIVPLVVRGEKLCCNCEGMPRSTRSVGLTQGHREHPRDCWHW